MVTRLSGGLTPANGADPRTFPAIWNSTAVDIETAEADIDVLQASVTANGTAVTALQGSAVALGSAVATLEGSAVALGSAIDVIEAWNLDDLNDVTIGTAVADAQVLAYSTAVSGWVNADVVGGGKILQVVSVSKTDAFTTASTTYVDVTGLTVSVTPSSTNSKIMILCSVYLGNNTSDGAFTRAQVLRNSTALGNNTTHNASMAVANSVNGDRNIHGGGFTFLDSPATTSSTTYKVQILAQTATTASVNRSGTNQATGSSHITVMEVAG